MFHRIHLIRSHTGVASDLLNPFAYWQVRATLAGEVTIESTVSRAALEDKLCRDLGTNIPPELPDPAPDKRWPRVPCCPFCGGRKTAAVNYDISWFKCFRCGNEASAGTYTQRTPIYSSGEVVVRDVPAGTDVIARHRAQIDQAIRNVRAKYGKWVPEWEARTVAEDRLLLYAGEPSDNDSDAGKLPEWETQVNGDPDERRERAMAIALALHLPMKAARKLVDDKAGLERLAESSDTS